jgi:glycosyltransferase involved in cell wall biosynthesis
MPPFNLGAILAAKAWGRPAIIKVCSVGPGGDVQKIKQLPFGFWFWRLFLLADRFIAPTSSVADELYAEGIERERISVVPNALQSVGEPVDKKTAKKLCELPDKPTFLYVGRLSPDKNLDVLLDAWTGFSRNHDANLVVVGAGPLFGRLETWRHGLDKPLSVILAGY